MPEHHPYHQATCGMEERQRHPEKEGRIDKGASRKGITRNRLLDVWYPSQTGLDILQTAHGFGRKPAYVGVQSASHKPGGIPCVIKLAKLFVSCMFQNGWEAALLTGPCLLHPLKACIKYKDVLLKVSVHKCSEAL